MPNTVASLKLMAFGCRSSRTCSTATLSRPYSESRPDRRFLGAVLAGLPDAVAAVRNRQQHHLLAAEPGEHVDDGVLVGRGRGNRVAVAQRRADKGGERNDDVRIRDQRAHDVGRSHVTAHERERRVIADRRQAVLGVHEVVDGRDGVTGVQQRGNQSRSNVPGRSGDEHFSHL